MSLGAAIPPFFDLRGVDASAVRRDALAAAAVAFMAVPQGIAYAIIAGLPPATGLYAAALPTVVGALFRSSRHVVTGPTNALSLLVGAAVARQLDLGASDPLTVGVTLAFTVGVIQALAGALRLGAIVDYVSSAVVLGYITGAGVLIGIGQLHQITATASPPGRSFDRIVAWVGELGAAHPPSVVLGVATVAFLVAVRRIDRRLPGPLLAMVLAIGANLAFGLEAGGMRVVADLTPVPAGLPPWSLPDLGIVDELVPVAVACTVLSLVESSAVARSIALETGQRLRPSWEFLGQGLANVAAGLTSAYPTSGSLTRSALNVQAGAATRLSGVLAGVLMVAVLLAFGPVVNHTPLPALGGLLVVVALDLVDVPRIRRVLRSGRADALAFGFTVVGTWVLPLDRAIYLGVGISLVMFLRQARLLVVRELVVDEQEHLTEVQVGETRPHTERCDHVRLLQLEGPLFFAAAGELLAALDEAVLERHVRVVVVRLKRTQGFDVTIANAFEATAQTLAAQGRHLILVGMRPEQMAALERTGARTRLGDDHLFPTRDEWFAAMEDAVGRALALAAGETHRGDCPLVRWGSRMAEPALPAPPRAVGSPSRG